MARYANWQYAEIALPADSGARCVVCSVLGLQRLPARMLEMLAVGVQEVFGHFENGEVIEILDEAGVVIAVAKSKLSSQQLIANLKTQNFEVANANDIVLI